MQNVRMTARPSGFFALGTRRNSSKAAIINIPQADVYRFGDANRATPLLRALNWSVKPNESWAVVGSGSGEKSHIFDMLMRHLRIHPPPPFPGLLPFLGDFSGDLQDVVSTVSFANKRAVGGGFYDYSARYGSVREEDQITLRQSMFSDTTDHLKARSRISLKPSKSPTERNALFERLGEDLKLNKLLDLPRIALSNGQTRRARILKALLAQPRLLLLDEPLTGLDVDSRAIVLNLFQKLHAKCDPHIILGMRIQDPIPEWITHLLFVNNGQVTTGPKKDVLEHILQVKNASEARERSAFAPIELGNPVVEMNNVSVSYSAGQRQILKNVAWTIRQGHRYHLQGSNGSGKTTLLSLLTGDHPQSYIQNGPDRYLRMFGTPRARLATPHLQSLIGVVTPELFDAFPRRSPGMSVWEVIATGFEGVFVSRGAVGSVDLSEEQTGWRTLRCWEVLGALGPCAWRAEPLPASDARVNEELQSFAARKFIELPVGEQRMVLLMRALVGKKELVLLDEVWSGMDHRMIAAARNYLRNGGVGPEQAVVVVTHLEEEVPWNREDGVKRATLVNGQLTAES